MLLNHVAEILITNGQIWCIQNQGKPKVVIILVQLSYNNKTFCRERKTAICHPQLEYLWPLFKKWL